MPDDQDQKFTIVYRRTADYRIFHGNVWSGSMTPARDGALLNLCIDHMAIPSYTVHDIEDGAVDMSVPPEAVTVGQVEREVLCGILVSTNEAKSLHHFLGQLIQTLENE